MPNRFEDFVQIAKGIAFLESVMSPDWEGRYYSFNSLWAENEKMASMRNGEGDAWFCLILEDSIAITGHLSGIKGSKVVFENLPQQFWPNFRDEPAFSTEDSCFCFFWTKSNGAWKFNFLNDQIESRISKYFEPYTDIESGYQNFTRWYYERSVDSTIIQRALRNEVFRLSELVAVNPAVNEEQITNDVEEIGYAAGI